MILPTSSTASANKAIVPFDLTEQGHIVFKATVNRTEGTFILDTGAGINLLTTTFSRKVNCLESKNQAYKGYRATGDSLEVDLYKAKTFEIDTFFIYNELFSIYPADLFFDGLISLTPFKNSTLTIDFVKKILIIGPLKPICFYRKNELIKIQILNDHNINLTIFMKIKLNNKVLLNVNLDSGAGFDVFRFNSKYLKCFNVNLSKIHGEWKRSEFVKGHENLYYYTNLAKMTSLNGCAVLQNFNATFISGLIYDGITSVNWIASEITIDIANALLIIKQRSS